MYAQKHNKSNFRSNHRLKNIKSVLKIIVNFYLCMSISVFIFVHCSQPKQTTMKNWKLEAKNLIGQAKVIEAIGLVEANGIKTGSLLIQAQELEAETEKHVKNKTQFGPGEYAKHSAKFSEITWALLQKIDGTNKPMPDYLK